MTQNNPRTIEEETEAIEDAITVATNPDSKRDWRQGLPAYGWTEDERFPHEVWRYEVASGDTLLGYADWVANQYEFAND